MCQRVIANTPKFLMFDLQKLKETEHLIFGVDYILIRPKTSGCTLHLANTHYQLHVGQLVLLAPFNPFRLSLEKHKDPTDCDVLHFRLTALGQTFVDSIQFDMIKQMLEKSSYGTLFEGEEIHEITQILDKMENTLEFGQVLNLLGLLEELSKLKPTRYLADYRFEVNNIKRTEDRVHVVLEYISEHLSESLSVTKVAEQLYMADSTFSRFFHANLGVTFRQYVIEQRVKQAARYLVLTDWTIAHIGSEVGFSSLSNFNAKFKQLLRKTPREYRLNHIDMRKDISSSRALEGQIQSQLTR
ncbi:helix-turn-helix transcriptional regulator [Vibrio sp. 03-59-1]|uniref:helix-turn-helix transcriptional regulator n=1 Tax=Vibrio sp. 03-59-1 TaxID=2607607 RepID=UPI0014939A04|nr:AraC family transcriptional regulator [Vibrio sp. 03-59-1]NOH82628.1 helix-turn-helix transcriptional regulator [Vibrio sp. 03-59-1]